MDALTPPPVQSLVTFVASHPEWSAERAGRRWAAQVFGAWDDGAVIPEELLQELADRYPLFAPDHLASPEVLLNRYASILTSRLTSQLHLLELAHAKLARKLYYKRYCLDGPLRTGLYAELSSRFEALEALRNELFLREQGIIDGPCVRAYLPTFLEDRARRRAGDT